MKEVTDKYIAKKKKLWKKLKIEEQVNQLKEILPKEYVYAGWLGIQRLPRFYTETTYVGDGYLIRIRDRKFESLESSGKDMLSPAFYIKKTGAIVVEIKPFKYIEVREKTLYNLMKWFGKKWNYKQLIKSW